jgi:hydrogenase expression/formation protein HypC
MCLAIPAKVIALRGATAVVETASGRREVDARLVSPRPGDYVILYGGAAVEVLDEAEALQVLRLLEEGGDVDA